MSTKHILPSDVPNATIKLEATEEFTNPYCEEKVSNDVKIDVSFIDDSPQAVFLKTETCVPVFETIKIEQEVLQCPVTGSIEKCQSNSQQTSICVKQESESIKPKPKKQISKHNFLHETSHRSVHANKPRRVITKDDRLKIIKQRKNVAINKEILTENALEKLKLKCYMCNYTCTNKLTYETHINLHNVEKIFKCDKCVYFAITKDMIDKHNLIHSSIESFKCDLCSFVTNRKNTIRRHITTHNNKKKFKCAECNYASKWKFNLKDHMLAKHNPLKPFKCELCGRTFLKENLLKSHLIEHTGFKCEICHKLFKTKNLLRSHKRIHTDRKLWAFKCDICDSNFLNKSTLNTHKLKHIGESHKCSQCDYKTVYKATLKRHLLKHGFGMNREKNGDKKPMIECEFCVYKCRRKQHLDNHLLKHTGEIPFQCNVCSRGLNTVYNLQRHSKLHSRKVSIVEDSKNLSFKCVLCDTGYSSVFSLMRHSVTHRQEKIVGL